MTSKREYSIRSVDSIIQKVDKWGLAIMAQSLLSIIWLLLIPKEPANAVILGYSLRRLALLFPMTLPFIFGFVLYFSAKKEAGWMTKLLSSKNLAATASFIIIGGAVFALGSWSLIFMPIFLRIITDLGLIYRTIPLLTSIFLLGMEAMIFVPLVIFPGKSPSNPEKKRFPIVTFLITLGVLLAIFILIEITGLGKDPERVSIISLGVPILESQIWYIVGLMALLIISVYSWHSLPANDHPQLRKHGDLIIASVLWLIAVVIWMSLPLPSNNYFAPEVQPPNFEKYPFSDAEQYDFNSLYVYYGSLENFVVSKPLYVSFLAILHAIGGLSYANIIFMQTLVVALFPPVLYLVGRELHSRLGGIAIALFAIFREVSNIQASSIANTSNTKLLLSDMPAALLAAVLALTIIRWFKLKEKRISGHEFLIGGLIGLLILTRIQTMALVPFGLILVVFRNFPKIKPMLLSMLVLLAGLALVISPILVRNHSITGVYWVDSPGSSSGLSRILTTGLETDEEFDPQPNGNVISTNIQVFRNILNQNLEIYLYSVGDNFSRNLISTLLLLPIRLGNGFHFSDYLRIDQPFWAEVYSKPNAINTLVILINFVMIAIGFSIALKQNTKPVTSLIGLYAVYNLSSAIIRLSGWRFILPVDWIIYVFFALGMLEALDWVIRRISGWRFQNTKSWYLDLPDFTGKKQMNWSWTTSFGFLFIFIGSIIPIREHLLPDLRPMYSEQETCERINAALIENNKSDLSEDFMTFCSSNETRVLMGYGLYPRYFRSGEGFYHRTYDPWFGKQDYSRLVFRLIGSKNVKVYIKTEKENAFFPNGAIVYIAGKDKSKFEAQFVLVEGEQEELIISTSILDYGEILFEE